MAVIAELVKEPKDWITISTFITDFQAEACATAQLFAIYLVHHLPDVFPTSVFAHYLAMPKEGEGMGWSLTRPVYALMIPVAL